MHKKYLFSPGHILCGDFITKNINRTFKKNFKFLDIGCGVGVYSNLILKNKKSEGVGIDLNLSACKENKKLNSKYIKKKKYSIINGNIHSHNFHEKFDVLLLWNVIEHLEVAEIKKILNKINLILNKDAILIIGVPANQKFWTIEDDCVGHKTRYNLELLKKNINNKQLRLIKHRALTFPLSNILNSFKIYIVKRFEQKKLEQKTNTGKTINSGYRKLMFYTQYPFYFKFLINKITLYPFIILQNIFNVPKLSYCLSAIYKKK